MGLSLGLAQIFYRHFVPTGLSLGLAQIFYRHSVPTKSRNQGINGMNALGHSPQLETEPTKGEQDHEELRIGIPPTKKCKNRGSESRNQGIQESTV